MPGCGHRPWSTDGVADGESALRYCCFPAKQSFKATWDVSKSWFIGGSVIYSGRGKVVPISAVPSSSMPR